MSAAAVDPLDDACAADATESRHTCPAPNPLASRNSSRRLNISRLHSRDNGDCHHDDGVNGVHKRSNGVNGGRTERNGLGHRFAKIESGSRSSVCVASRRPSNCPPFVIRSLCCSGCELRFLRKPQFPPQTSVSSNQKISFPPS